MVLRTVKKTLQKYQRMTLSQLSAETGEDRESLSSALAYFVDRGNVFREVESASGVTCGTTCKSCPIAQSCLAGGTSMTGLEVFVWREIQTNKEQ